MFNLFEFFSLGLIVLLGAISPGPDFVLVTKNSLIGSRRMGILTGLGVALALLIHVLYSSLGLAVIIQQSKIVYTIIKYAGAAYLFYLGSQLIWKQKVRASEVKTENMGQEISAKQAFVSGFLCNILNPKAGLFVMGLFTQIVQPTISVAHLSLIASEIVLITFSWFALLSFILTHPSFNHRFKRIQPHLTLVMGILLIGFAFKLIFF